MVTRDIDLLKRLAEVNAVVVILSVTTLRPELARVLEPRASSPDARLRAVQELRDAGIPAGVFTAPVIPGLTDHEMPAILKAASEAGACAAGYVLLRLPSAVAGLFEQWLEQHHPESKEKVLGRLRDSRNGELNDSRFGVRMTGEGEWAKLFRDLFRLTRRKVGIPDVFPQLSAEAFQIPAPEPTPEPENSRGLVQRSLFDLLDE